MSELNVRHPGNDADPAFAPLLLASHQIDLAASAHTAARGALPREWELPNAPAELAHKLSSTFSSVRKIDHDLQTSSMHFSCMSIVRSLPADEEHEQLVQHKQQAARQAQVTLMALVSTALQDSRAVVTALQSPASGTCSQTLSERAADPQPKEHCKGHALPCAMCHKPLLHASSDLICSKCSDGHSIASLPVSCVKSLLHAISCEGVAMRDQGSHINSLILHHLDAHGVCSSQQGSCVDKWDSATQQEPCWAAPAMPGSTANSSQAGRPWVSTGNYGFAAQQTWRYAR